MGGGGLIQNILVNGSVADIDDQRVARRVSRANQISLAMRCVQTQSVHCGDTEDHQREVSRSHSNWDKTNWGVQCPFKQ